MTVIRPLPPDVVARIAAGEVIERPASVAKELVENAIDAGARVIEVELVGGGIDLVRVSDDGHGIPAEQVEIAFQRHATSKIASDRDLSVLSTLGFRGEALPSIAAVARVSLTTRQPDDPVGASAKVEYGHVTERRALGRAGGTSVAVADLFGQLPARRKFLRSRASEAASASQVVANYSLAYPEIAFRLISEGREVLRTNGEGDRKAALLAVFGPEVARDVVEVSPRTGADHARLFVAITGVVGRQWLHRANRAAICVFVNRRLVQHRGLLAAVEQAYETLIPTGRHPVAVLDVTVPPDEADFNVHPAKAEVRLLRDRAIAGLVFEAIQEALAIGTDLLAWGDGAATISGERLGELRVLGQAGGTYIIAEGGAGVYLVDQHAAHERVLLEDLRERQVDEDAVQLLLEPAVVELDPHQAALATQHLEEFASLGFALDQFGPRSLLLRGVPAIAANRDPGAVLRATIDGTGEHAGVLDWRERLAVSLSCHTAVRAGDPLSHEEMQALLTRLGEAELCRTCSHGRPTAILLSLSQLEKEFGRR